MRKTSERILITISSFLIIQVSYMSFFFGLDFNMYLSECFQDLQFHPLIDQIPGKEVPRLFNYTPACVT